ncbi:MAG TPA: hypothetical protein EYH54_01255 [Nautiliaceae bacterium]|nr:hypothetical protein [Nautiliaceae bacterium]
MRLSEAKTFKDLFGNLVNIKIFVIVILFSLALTLITDGFAEGIKSVFNIPFQIIIGLIIAISIFLFVKKDLNKLNQISLDVQTKSPEKTKNLILFLSHLNSDDQIKIIKNAMKLEDLKDKRINWEMPAIAIKYHLPQLKNITVITSNESKNQFNEFKEFIKRVFPENDLNIEMYKNHTNFENVEEVYTHLKDAFYNLKKSKKAKRDREIIIDVTSGPKIPSIAGAIFTLEAEERKFQYVSTKTKEVIGFDILKVSKED